MGRADLKKKLTDFVQPIATWVKVNQTVEEALSCLRVHSEEKKIFYLYVVDDNLKLKGVVSMRSLLMSPLEKKVQDIAEDKVVFVSTENTLEHALEKLARHRLLALPVVDQELRLVGAVDVEVYLGTQVDVAKEKRNERDLFQILGLHLEEGKSVSVAAAYQKRMPWIFCNMFGGIACAIISRLFEIVLLEVIVLAMFIPLVLSLSESIAMQSMTYSLQSLHTREIGWRQLRQKIYKETKVLILIGLSCAIIVGFLSMLWEGAWEVALTIALGIGSSIILSGILGALIPVALHRYKLDPKVAAGPIVLMWADIITTTIYLTFALFILLR